MKLQGEIGLQVYLSVTLVDLIRLIILGLQWLILVPIRYANTLIDLIKSSDTIQRQGHHMAEIRKAEAIICEIYAHFTIDIIREEYFVLYFSFLTE